MIKEGLLSAEGALGGPTLTLALTLTLAPTLSLTLTPNPSPNQAALGGIAALALLAGVLGAGSG